MAQLPQPPAAVYNFSNPSSTNQAITTASTVIDPQLAAINDGAASAQVDDLDLDSFLLQHEKSQQQARTELSSRGSSVDPSLRNEDSEPSAERGNLDSPTTESEFPSTSELARKRPRRSQSTFSLADDDDWDDANEKIRRKRAQDVVNLIKNSIALTPQSQNLLEIAASNTPEFTVYLQTALLLSTRDKLLAMEESWEPPKELMTNVKQYAWAFLLGPCISAYRDTNLKLLILLRKASVKHVPDESDRGRTHIILSAITREMTLVRSSIKLAITKSISGDLGKANGRGKQTEPAKSDIASLVHFIARNCDVKITAHHYIRIAFLRWCAVKHAAKVKDKDDEKDDFWGAVDQELKVIREKIRDPHAQVAWFTMVLDKDKEKYGQLSTEFRLYLPREVDAWQSLAEAKGNEHGFN